MIYEIKKSDLKIEILKKLKLKDSIFIYEQNVKTAEILYIKNKYELYIMSYYTSDKKLVYTDSSAKNIVCELNEWI